MPPPAAVRVLTAAQPRAETFAEGAQNDRAEEAVVAVITGDDKGNKLEGTSDPDLIRGNGGNDELSGLGSDDQLDPGPGRDGVDGGPGSDTLLLHEAMLVSLADGDTESLE